LFTRYIQVASGDIHKCGHVFFCIFRQICPSFRGTYLNAVNVLNRYSLNVLAPQPETIVLPYYWAFMIGEENSALLFILSSIFAQFFDATLLAPDSFGLHWWAMALKFAADKAIYVTD